MRRLLPARARGTWLILLLLTALAACDSSGPEDDPPDVVGVVVANQGNFSDANGSVTLFDPMSGTASQFLTDVGSTTQSVFLRGMEMIVLSNTANRLDIVSIDGSIARATIENVLSPRYMALVTQDKAYVTSLFFSSDAFSGGKLTIVDLATRAPVGEIEVGDNPEGIAIVGNRAFVANSGFGSGRTLSVIDMGSDAVVETVDLECDGPRFVLVDADEEVWAFCTGNEFAPSGATMGAVRVIDPVSLQIVSRIEINGRISTVGPGQDAAAAPALGFMYAVLDASSVLRFDTQTNDLLDVIGPIDGPDIGAIAVDERSERLYLGRVPSFTESGEVTVHDLAGVQVDRFAAGIAPTYILFDRSD